MSRQQLPYSVGISEATAGAKNISMNLIIIPPGGAAYIKADVPHQPINLSATEAAMALVARNDPNEQEHVVAYHAERKHESDTH